MKKELQVYINELEKETDNISPDRKKKLRELSEYMAKKRRSGDTVSLIYICTHNSRRSHLCQIWTAVLADYLELKGIESYSGGTKVTALNPRAADALKRAGFSVENPGGDNPHYRLYYDEDKDPLICYSKTFDNQSNPDRDFIAVMTCTDADEACPIVPGAAWRISLPYKDPKVADGTPQESETYDQRCLQIASEMYYMLKGLK
ncbi:MAG: protein-tyrosine-phosphatase [Balneolaceae bacterium]|nr:protein-tyrosine-phosphatase [Balneolaceae bacterium]